MELFDVLEKRHSVRAYKEKDVEEWKIKKILNAAVIAPTAANRQAFKIVVIKTKGRENELKKIYGSDWFSKAPVVIGIFSVPGKAWTKSSGKNYGDVDAAIVMDHIILSATDLGLGTCWIGAFNSDNAKKMLFPDEDAEPIAFTPIGYPADTEFKKIRKDINELVFYK
ncbi:MAG TPA: nitroreductase [Clostridiaceae bacterium]|jgi:nitroreductase|nr:nitroreductase [Clostridiaceae bacterium]